MPSAQTLFDSLSDVSKDSKKMTYANSGDPDQTAPERAV